MKRILSVLIVMIMLVSSFSITAFAEESEGFSDINGHWAESTIMKYKDSNIICGYGDGTFRPDQPVTRSEFAKIVTCAFQLYSVDSINYDDVDSSDWYYPYVNRSHSYIPCYPLPTDYDSNRPYSEAYESGRCCFLPDEYALRMHVAETLVRIKRDRDYKTSLDMPDIQGIKTELNSIYKDSDYESLYALHETIPANVEHMFRYTWLANKYNIMVGNPDGYFNPYGYMTRAELLTAIDNVLDADAE
ncbi:MAG: S-layer homology domain-containing protein [Anaerovoracaceae bacterium]|jgi:hypothetical protein